MDDLKELFFNESLRHWHFGELIKKSNLSRERVNYFLKILLKKKLVIRIKPRNKMPYYIASRDSLAFREQKRLWGLQKLSVLFEHINSLHEVKTAIVFGSFSRGDWSKSSDIDLFIYGNGKNFEKNTLENRLHREIQLFIFNSPREVKRGLDAALLSNIIKGFNIKGSLEPFEVVVHA